MMCILTNTRRPEKVDYKSLSLTLNEIIEPKFFMVSLYQRLEERFATRRNNEISKCIVVPLHILYFFDIEFH